MRSITPDGDNYGHNSPAKAPRASLLIKKVEPTTVLAAKLSSINYNKILYRDIILGNVPVSRP